MALMLMLYQILLCTKCAEAVHSSGYALSPTVELSPTATFCNSKLSLFSPKNAQISSLNTMEMF